MAEYTDYGYTDTQATFAHTYLLKPIIGLLDKTRHTTVLDLGCGNGSLVNSLLKCGFNAYGTDASPQGISLANGLNPGRFFLQDFGSNDMPDELRKISFDTIISTEVIEHLYNPKRFIEFAKTVLEKNGGGELIISTPYNGYLKNLALSLTDSWDNHLDPLWDGGHIKFWSRKTLSVILKQHGFEIKKFIGCGRAPYLWKSMIIISTLNR